MTHSLLSGPPILPPSSVHFPHSNQDLSQTLSLHPQVHCYSGSKPKSLPDPPCDLSVLPPSPPHQPPRCAMGPQAPSHSRPFIPPIPCLGHLMSRFPHGSPLRSLPAISQMALCRDIALITRFEEQPLSISSSPYSVWHFLRTCHPS